MITAKVAGRTWILSSPVGDKGYRCRFAPSTAARVVHQDPATTGGTELQLYPLVGSEWKIFAGFVLAHSKDATITAYDSDGRIVATYNDFK